MVHSVHVEVRWLGEWPDHDWQVWQYSVGHAQLHVRGIPTGDPGGECIELLFKPVYRLATSTMSWSGLTVALRRVTPEGAGVFFLRSTRMQGRHTGFGVIRSGSLHIANAGLRYSHSVIDYDSLELPWTTLWATES